MSWRAGVLAAALGLCPGVVAASQSPSLTHALRPGRHEVGMRLETRGGRAVSVWYPVADTGRFPLVLLRAVSDAAPPSDTATAVFLASHGFVVMLAAGAARGDARAQVEVELHPANALVSGRAGGRWLSVAAPSGPSDHVRLRGAVIRAFLDSVLRGLAPSLADLARRLTRAGLVVHSSS